MSAAADLSLPPQAPATSEQLAAVLRAVRVLSPSRVSRATEAERAAWSMLSAQLQAYRLVASIPADSALSGVPRDLRGAHALWVEVRNATTARLVAEVRAHTRGGSPLAARLRDAMMAAAKTATTVDGLFEDLTGGRL